MQHVRTSKQEDESTTKENQAPNHQAKQHDSNPRSSHQNTQMSHSHNQQASQFSKQRDVQKISSGQCDAKIGTSTTKGLYMSQRQNDPQLEKSDPDLKKGAKAEQRTPSYLGEKAFSSISQNSDKKEPIENESQRNPEEDNDNIQSRKMKDDVVMAEVDEHSAPEEIAPANPSDAVQGHDDKPTESKPQSDDDELKCDEKYDQFNALTPIQQMDKKDSAITFCGLGFSQFAKKSNRHQMSNQNDSILDDINSQLGKIISPYIKPPKTKLNIPMVHSPFSPYNLNLSRNALNQMSGLSPQKISKIKSAMQNKQSCVQPSVLQAIYKNLAPHYDQARAKLGATINDRGLNAKQFLCSQSNDNVQYRSHRKNSEFTPLDLQLRQDSRIMNAQTIGNEELQSETFASPYVQKRPNFNPSFNPFNHSHGKIGKGSKKSSSDNGLDEGCYQNHPPVLFSETIMKISSSPPKKMKGSSTKDKNAVGIKQQFIQTPAKRRTSAVQSPNVGSNHTSKIKTSIDNITPAKEKTINGVGTDCKNALSTAQQNQFRLKTNGGSIVDSNFKINKNSLFKGVLNSEKSKNRSHCHKSHKSNRVEKLNYDQEGMSNTKTQLFANQVQPSFVSKLDYEAAYNNQQLMNIHYQNQQFYPQSIQNKSQEKLNKNVSKLNHPPNMQSAFYKCMQNQNLAYMNSVGTQLNNGNFQQTIFRKYGSQCNQNQPSSSKNKPEIGNMEGIPASASPEFAHQMVNQNTSAKQHRSTGHSNNDESVFKEENQDNHSINHIMPNVIYIGGQFKNNNDMGPYPSISPQKKSYNRMLEQQMFSPDQLKRNINIHSTNKKSKWSSNFKKTGQIDMNDQNTPLKDSPFLIRRQSKIPRHIDFQNLRDSSESKGIVNSKSSGFSGSGSGGSSSSSDENGGPSSSSNQENSQMSLNKMEGCQQPNQYTFLYENGLFKYMQPPNYKAQSVYAPGFHPTPELIHLPGCQFKCTCGLWQYSQKKGPRKTPLNSSSKKAKQQDSDKAQPHCNQRKQQCSHGCQEEQESHNATNESKRRSHSTENNISIYHNPQINITSQNIIQGCHGRPGNMNYQQPYPQAYMNQNYDMGQFFSQMAPQNPNMAMMPFFNSFVQNFQQHAAKNFVSQNQQSAFNHFNQQQQNLNNQTNTKTNNTKVAFDFSEENQATKKQNKKNQQATELSKRIKNSQKLLKKEKQQKKEDQIEVQQLNNTNSVQIEINEELEGSNIKRLVKQKSKQSNKKLAQKDSNVKLLQDITQQAEIEDSMPGEQTTIVQQIQVDDIDKATQKQTNEQQESNAVPTTSKNKLSTTNITPQKSNMESLVLNNRPMMSFGIDGRPSAGTQLFESTQKIQHTQKGKNTAEKQGFEDRSIFDSGIKDHIFKTPNSQDKIQMAHFKTNLKEIPGVGNLDKKHPLEEFDATTSIRGNTMYIQKQAKGANVCQTSQKKRNNTKKQLNSNLKTQNPNRLSVKEKELENQLLEQKIKEKTRQITVLTITQEQLIARKKLQPGLVGCQGCKCKNSKCLKLYCECLRNNATCGPECQCHKHGDCFNDDDHQEERMKAIEDILKRNIKAFESKVDKDKNEHFKGCNCKNSMCQKKYCECFERGVPCTGKCKCQECRNTVQSCERHQDTSLNDNILSDIKKEITKEGNTIGDSYQKSSDQKMQIDLIQTADKIQQKNQIDQHNIQIERPFDPSLHDEVQNIPINPDPNASKPNLEVDMISASLILEEDDDAFVQNKNMTEINQYSPIILEEKDEKMEDESVNVDQSEEQRDDEEVAGEDESVSQIQNSNTHFLEIHEVSYSQKISVQSQYNQAIKDEENINQSHHSQAEGGQHKSPRGSAEENVGEEHVEIHVEEVKSANQEHQVAIQDQESDDKVTEQQVQEQELHHKHATIISNEELDMKQSVVIEEDAVIEEVAEQHDEQEQAEEPQQAQEVGQYKKKPKLLIGKQISRPKKHQDESLKEKPFLDSQTRNIIKQSQNGKKTVPRIQSQSSMNQNDMENLEPSKLEKKESLAEATTHKKEVRAPTSPIKIQTRQSKRIQQKLQKKSQL